MGVHGEQLSERPAAALASSRRSAATSESAIMGITGSETFGLDQAWIVTEVDQRTDDGLDKASRAAHQQLRCLRQRAEPPASNCTGPSVPVGHRK
jgi:hypothetical protein